jgi:hypothetical protein
LAGLEKQIVHDRAPFTHEDENGRAPAPKSRHKQAQRFDSKEARLLFSLRSQRSGAILPT